MSKPSFTPKELVFIAAYMANGFNGTQAAMTAGWSPTNPNAAGVKAHELLRNPKIKAEVERRTAERLAKLAMSAEEWAAEVGKLARSSMREVLHVTADGDPYIDLAKASPEFMDAMEAAEIEDFVDRRERDAEGNVVSRDVRRVKVKLHSKLKALELVGKHLKLLTDRTEVDVGEGFAEVLDQAFARAEQARRKRIAG